VIDRGVDRTDAGRPSPGPTFRDPRASPIEFWNAPIALNEKELYAVSFLLSLFAAVAVQKNVRDLALFGGGRPDADP
jgi:hypothetical protein